MRDVSTMTEDELYEERDDLEEAIGKMRDAQDIFDIHDIEGVWLDDAVEGAEKRLQEVNDAIGVINYKANMAVMAESYYY